MTAPDKARELLAEIIRTRLLGVQPDDQDVVLDDADWRLILAALSQPETVREAVEALEEAEGELYQIPPRDDEQVRVLGVVRKALASLRERPTDGGWLTETARFLFGLLDDIDTLDDAAKGDDAAFRDSVRRVQRKRFEVASTDGYSVVFTAPAGDGHLEWAVAKWRDEVANRPLQNVHRRSLDTTWREVIRRFGGDPVALVGPAHDDIIAAAPPRTGEVG